MPNATVDRKRGRYVPERDIPRARRWQQANREHVNAQRRERRRRQRAEGGRRMLPAAPLVRWLEGRGADVRQLRRQQTVGEGRADRLVCEYGGTLFDIYGTEYL